ncbi:MAG: DUF3617 family protein [Acidobacteriaceae bacterium]
MKAWMVLGSLVLAGLPVGAPPMKMGLWEASMTTSITRDGTATQAQVMKVRACYTAETYAAAFGSPMGGAASRCTKWGDTWTSNSYTADYSCPSANGSVHVAMVWSDKESGSGSVHMVVNPSGHSVTIDTKIASHFVSADCGAVKPGAPQIMR